MAFTVAAVMLGGFTLYNLSSARTSAFHLDPQQRLESAVGNKGANINLPQVMNKMRPITDPGRYMSTRTYYKKFKAKTDAISSDPVKRKNGIRDVSKYDYRRGQGYMVDPNRNMEVRWG